MNLREGLLAIVMGAVIVGIVYWVVFFAGLPEVYAFQAEIEDREGFISYMVEMNVSGQVDLEISGPDREVLWSDSYYAGDHTIRVTLGEYRSLPEVGSYEVVLSDTRQRIVFEKSFSVASPAVQLSGVQGVWWREEGVFSLVGIEFDLRNLGGVSLFPSSLELDLGGVTSQVLVLPVVVGPGESVHCFAGLYEEGLTHDGVVSSFVLHDAGGERLASWSGVLYPSDPVDDEQFSFRLGTKRYSFVMPDLEELYSFYSELDRLDAVDYIAYGFDPYDDWYLELVSGKILELFSEEDDVGQMHGFSAFMGSVFSYENDSECPACEGIAQCEYAKFPVETLVERRGDCEDTAILLCSLLWHAGFDVGLLRLPDHMAVGVVLPEDAVSFDYFVQDYFFLETTAGFSGVGRVPEEYEGVVDVTVYPYVQRGLGVHGWKNATLFRLSTGDVRYVRMDVVVDNLGVLGLEDCELCVQFLGEDGGILGETFVSIDDVDAFSRCLVHLKREVPNGVVVKLVTQLLVGGSVVDERFSTELFGS